MQLQYLFTRHQLLIKHPLRRTLLFFLMASVFFVSLQSCKQKQTTVADVNTFYTCSMHPQIMEPHPGKCPICAMKLIPVTKDNTPGADEIKLSDQQIQLGNVRVDTIGKQIMNNETLLNAILNFNQQKLVSVSSRVMGRVDVLYHKNIGDYIKKGSPLLEIYSEELNNAKQEYLIAIERRNALDNSVINFDQIIESAKTKLLLWGMSENQINELVKTKNTKQTTRVYSKESGYITSINVREGDYITEGGLIVQLADLSSLWAEAQIYTSQFAQLNIGGNVTVGFPDFPGKLITGKIDFANPEIDPEKRLNLIRVTIPNTSGQLKPGMQAYVIIKGQQTNSLSLPMDAVLRTGNSTTVWVQTGVNTFKNKMVTTGVETNERIAITDGLQPGEVVVTSGAYLLNSEYIFKNGANPMAGMKM